MTLSAKSVGRLMLVALFSYFIFVLLFTKDHWIILDAANLVFHEAGHLIFLPFGQFAHFLGGSLFQILFPCMFLSYFIFRKDLFAIFVVLFWVAENIINVSFYMQDAVIMRIPLLIDGTIHDWNWIFSHLGILAQSEIIGIVFYYFGAILAILSLFGMVISTIVKANEGG